MKNKIYLLLLSCLGIMHTSLAQTTINMHLGGGRAYATYIYDNATYKVRGEDLNLAFSFDKELKRGFAIHTEMGFHATNTNLNIKPSNTYISGYHQYQQVYLALGPEYFFTTTEARPFINTGLMMLIDTKNALDTYNAIIPFDGGASGAKAGIFLGLGVKLRQGQTSVLIELRNIFQSDQNDQSSGTYIPAHFKLYRTNMFIGLGYDLN